MPYASKYYDPIKAHEYYERTKVLKGYEDRYGGSRGNETSAASGGYTGNISSRSRISGTIRSSSSKITDGNGKTLTATQAHNMQIKQQIASLKKQLDGMSKADRKVNRKAINDQIQSLREQTKGGSTSGFNQKGKEAAAYIKSQIEKERDDVIKKTNKDIDDSMLNQVKRLQAHVKSVRESGQDFDNKEFISRVKVMLGNAKKIKAKSKKKYLQDYTQRYKDEIDKLRNDRSMYTYYDKLGKTIKSASKYSKSVFLFIAAV